MHCNAGERSDLFGCRIDDVLIEDQAMRKQWQSMSSTEPFPGAAQERMRSAWQWSRRQIGDSDVRKEEEQLC